MENHFALYQWVNALCYNKTSKSGMRKRFNKSATENVFNCVFFSYLAILQLNFKWLYHNCMNKFTKVHATKDGQSCCLASVNYYDCCSFMFLKFNLSFHKVNNVIMVPEAFESSFTSHVLLGPATSFLPQNCC